MATAKAFQTFERTQKLTYVHCFLQSVNLFGCFIVNSVFLYQNEQLINQMIDVLLKTVVLKGRCCD